MKHTLRSHAFGSIGFLIACWIGWGAMYLTDRLPAMMPVFLIEGSSTSPPRGNTPRSDSTGTQAVTRDAVSRHLRIGSRKWRFIPGLCNVGLDSNDESGVVCGNWLRAGEGWSSRHWPILLARLYRTEARAVARMNDYERGEGVSGEWTRERCELADDAFRFTATGAGGASVVFRHANIIVHVTGSRRSEVEELARLSASLLGCAHSSRCPHDGFPLKEAPN
jgi:hypothetical protein